MIILYVLTTLLALIGPIVAAVLLLRRIKIEWQVLIYGMIAYIAADVILRLVYTGLDQVVAPAFSQVQDILTVYLLAALIFGLVTALISLALKWVIFRFFRANTNSWNRAAVVGLGYGGFEVMLAIGVPLTFALITFLTYNGQDLIAMGLAPEQATQAQEFLAAFQGQPISSLLTYIIQSVLQVGIHILTAVLVWYGYTQRKYAWIAAALVWLTVVTAGQIFISQVSMLTETDSPVWLVWLAFTIFTYWMLLQTRKRMQVEEE